MNVVITSTLKSSCTPRAGVSESSRRGRGCGPGVAHAGDLVQRRADQVPLLQQELPHVGVPGGSSHTAEARRDGVDVCGILLGDGNVEGALLMIAGSTGGSRLTRNTTDATTPHRHPKSATLNNLLQLVCLAAPTPASRIIARVGVDQS